MFKLKTFSFTLSSIFILSVFVAAIGLFIFSNRMMSATSRIAATVESIQVAEELEILLLSHNRNTFILQLEGNEPNRDRLKDNIEELNFWLDRAQNYIGSKKEALIFEEAKLAIEEYLGLWQRLKTQDKNPVESYLTAAPSLLKAQEKITNFMNVNLEQAHEAQNQVTTENRFANSLGLLITLFCFIVFPLVWHLVRHWIYTPIEKLHQNISEARDKGTLQKSPTPGGVYEIRQMAEVFQGLIENLALQKKNQLQFLAGVAHDLRNPLNAIRMSADSLHEGELPPEAQKSLSQIISRQSKHLERLVSDFLDSTRIESGELEIEQCHTSLLSLLTDAVTLHSALSSSHRFDLKGDNIQAYVDPVRIGQVINNVLGNAIKYSPEGGTIFVQLYSEAQWATIGIKDEGIGIATEDLHTIFEPFRRTQRTKASIPGIGLGLSVSKKIIEAHGGRIEVQSQIGHGSSFKIYLPMKVQEASSQ